ncbi:MAG: RNA methyltransferase [Ruminococcus sp.]|nr:RNA methyltransferase [Ruminococcus sp.]
MNYGYKKITARDNPEVKLYRRLSGIKKARMQEKSFVLEGYRLVLDALKNGAPIKNIFITDDAFLKYGGELSHFENGSFRVNIISKELGEYMAETECPQGIFAVCSMNAQIQLSEFLKNGSAFVVLYMLQDPGNAGMILRTADALGISGVIFCKSCDIYSPKVVRATMGSLFRVPVAVCNDINELFFELETAGIESDAAVVQGQAELVGQSEYDRKRRAVWIGNEGNGLAQEVICRCSRRITIPMHGNIESLNAAMAAGILMWEMMKGKAYGNA